MAKKWRDLDTIRENLKTAKENVAKYTKELKETQEHELIKNSNEMFEKFKKLAGDDSKMEDMLAYFQNSIDNAKPEDFEEEEETEEVSETEESKETEEDKEATSDETEETEETDATATAEDDETEAVEETDEVDTSFPYGNNIY